MLRFRRLLLVGLLLLMAFAPSAEQMPVPAEVQYPLFLKILTLDRNLKTRVGDELVIGIVYQAQIRESWRAKDDFVEAMKQSALHNVRDVPVRAVPIALGDASDLPGAIARHDLDALYIGPLRAVEIEQVAEVAQAARVNTLTGVPAYVGAGLAVGVGLKEQRPEILINLKAARAEGADFNAQLLRVARVVGE